jgi:alkylhydroperoxidase family enzyme
MRASAWCFATRIMSRSTGRVPDALFEALRAQLSEQKIVELTWLCAFTTYLNRLAVPLGVGSDGFCALLPPAQRP